ncbi:MAG: hypothetical protein H0X65_10910 [Gemmatimonadetes bacterium]|nr:hypothetical protein [Gemmatimonadota bacterium]
MCLRRGRRGYDSSIRTCSGSPSTASRFARVRFPLRLKCSETRDSPIRRLSTVSSRRKGGSIIEPSCGACINAGPGVSRRPTDITVSAINRNFPGRSGPGQLYLASPFTVAASAMAGEIVEWTPQEAPAGV